MSDDPHSGRIENDDPLDGDLMVSSNKMAFYSSKFLRLGGYNNCFILIFVLFMLFKWQVSICDDSEIYTNELRH